MRAGEMGAPSCLIANGSFFAVVSPRWEALRISNSSRKSSSKLVTMHASSASVLLTAKPTCTTALNPTATFRCLHLQRQRHRSSKQFNSVWRGSQNGAAPDSMPFQETVSAIPMRSLTKPKTLLLPRLSDSMCFSGIEKLPTRAIPSWQARLCASTTRRECGDRKWSGVVFDNAEGKVTRKLKIGPFLGGGNEWRGRNGSKVRYAPSSNSVAEAPASRSEASNPDVGISEEQHGDAVAVDVEERGQQGGGGESSSEEEAELVEQGFTMSQICDRLIEVFLTERTSPAEWRSLLVFSTEWVRIRPHFFKRCKAMAKAETVADKKRKLTKLARQVKEVDDNMTRHDALLAEIEKNVFEIDTIVAKRRKEFTGEFFEHLQTLCDATARANRRDEIARVAAKCLSLVEAHDAALEDTEAITEAKLQFDTILSSPSLDAAANKISQLAKSKELDSTLLLLITKAWAEAKDSTMMTQEAKDIMCFIYKTAKTSMLKLAPDEIKIIKHLLSIPDPRERFAAMTDAFSPGDELEDKKENAFHTTPDKLRHWMKLILDAYHANKQGTMIKEAQKLMNPEVISRLEILLEYMDETFIL